MNKTIFENEFIYIPFINYYENLALFATLKYPHKVPISGASVFTITRNFNDSIFKYNIEDAKKIFSTHLRGLCPKRLWQNYGLLKMTYQEFLYYKPKYKMDRCGIHFIPVNDLIKRFEVLKI
jgi:hypothetical protein